MRPETERALRAIDRRFYDRHAAGFAGSRQLPWPGWQRALATLNRTPSPLRVLDAGCAHARLARHLVARWPRRSLAYCGIDRTLPLLERGRRALGDLPLAAACLLQADLLEPLPLAPAPGFDLIALFGLLHHVPGVAGRRRLVARLARRLRPGGVLALTAWRVERQPGFATKRLAWERAAPHVDIADLDPGDHLLVWGDDRATPRYCHALGDAEVDRLVPPGAAVLDRFQSDGPDDDRNRYLVLGRP